MTDHGGQIQVGPTRYADHEVLQAPVSVLTMMEVITERELYAALQLMQPAGNKRSS